MTQTTKWYTGRCFIYSPFKSFLIVQSKLSVSILDPLIFFLFFFRSDYEDMPLQNGRAIKATAKYQDESDSDWGISDCVHVGNSCAHVQKGCTWIYVLQSVHNYIFKTVHVYWMYCFWMVRYDVATQTFFLIENKGNKHFVLIYKPPTLTYPLPAFFLNLMIKIIRKKDSY